MQKRDETSPMYPCMMQPNDLRRVHHPHDEHAPIARSRVLRVLARLAGAARR